MKALYLVPCLALVAATFDDSPALAGARLNGVTVTITVSGATGSASGALGSVRNSTDSVEEIFCAYYYNGSQNPGIIACSATNSAGLTKSCTMNTTSPAASAVAITGDGFVYFSWDGSGACTEIHTYSDSLYEPKLP